MQRRIQGTILRRQPAGTSPHARTKCYCRPVSSISRQSRPENLDAGEREFRPLMVRDPWLLPGLQVRSDVRHSGSPLFSRHVVHGNFEAAWDTFRTITSQDPTVLRNVDRKHLTAFVALFTISPMGAHQVWPRLLKFKLAMQMADIPLSAQEYTHMIKVAHRSREWDEAEDLWQAARDASQLGDVEIWNAYIEATCQAYPMFWPAKYGFSYLQRATSRGAKQEPPKTNDVLQLLQYMELQGVIPNARTYELVLLSFARSNRLDISRKIVSESWLNEDRRLSESSILWPSVSTLTAIVDGFSYNGEVEEAIALIGQLQGKYHISLSSKEASTFWARLLQWIGVLAEPRTQVPAKLFQEVWDTMINKYGHQPTPGIWMTRLKYLRWKNQFGTMVSDIEKILSKNSPETQTVAASAISFAVRGYAMTSQPLEALSLLETWSKKGLDLRLDLEDFVLRKSGGLTRDQLRMYQEDDDEDDSLMGLS